MFLRLLPAIGLLAACEPLVLRAERTEPPAAPLCEAAEFVVPVPRTGAQLAACDRGRAAVVGVKGFDSLQEAIRDAADGRTVHVCPGTHTGPIQIWGRRLAIAAADPSKPAPLLRSEDGRVIDISDSTVSISGLGITGGTADVGGGVHVIGSALQLRDVLLRDNVATVHGGAVAAEGSAVILRSTRVTGNYAIGSGGAMALDGGCLIAETTQFLDNITEQNGGAVYYDGQPPSDIALTLRGSRFSRNQAQGRGGGVALTGAAKRAEVLVIRSFFEQNRAGTDGGGLAIDGQGEIRVVVSHATFVENRAPRNGGAVWGRGRLEYTLDIDDSEFVENMAAGLGGAVFHRGQSQFDELRTQGAAFLANRATEGTALATVGARSTMMVDSSHFSQPYHRAAALLHPKGPFSARSLSVEADAPLEVVSACGRLLLPPGQDFDCNETEGPIP